MSEPVQVREFNDAIRRLSDQVVEGNNTARDILVEAKRTNGRVSALEQAAAVLALRVALIEKTEPVTKRDLYIGLGVLTAAGGLVTWLPRLLAAAVAP